MAAKNGPPPLMNLEEMDKNMFCKSEQPENSCLVPDSMKTKLPPLPDVWKTFSSTMPDFQFPNPQSQGPNLSNVEIKQEKLDTDEYPCQFGENSQSQVQGAAALPNFGGGMPPMLPCFDKSELIVFNMAVLGVVIRQTVQFAKTLPEFRYLDYEDQAVLIKAAILEVLMFRMGETFLPEKNCVVDDIVGIEWNLDIMLYSGFFNSAQKTLNFTRSINSFHLSRAEFSLLEAATILSSDRPELKHPNAVELIQQKILLTLQASCKTNHPDDKVLFAKLVVKLAEVRELVQNHIDDLNEFKLPNHESMFPLISEIFNMDEEMYSGMSQNADTS
ncbi:nuclear receptor subfamily 1 group D member 2-like [Saccoglossus kowalevskii]|uniref:Nuclear receptor subfamily 1 group D member 2-like n=1 Tax=Saccoglossus kowalevskii TaxID=10224 RepID=A0ABM0LZZ9_SACKO|nr:PREDICTED: nuclear receptor subfamily 1 group D member 2-like [Saccoglossus kowalevskii]